MRRSTAGRRAALPGYAWLESGVTEPSRLRAVEKLLPVASELGCSIAQLAIAWCLKNPHVSTVILGASRVEQLKENLGALDVVPALTAEVMARIDAATR